MIRKLFPVRVTLVGTLALGLSAFAGADQSDSHSDHYVRLPASDTHYRRVKGYIEDTPEPDYRQASEAAREAFRDLKFGLRIHWGVYCLWETGESWPCSVTRIKTAGVSATLPEV